MRPIAKTIVSFSLAIMLAGTAQAAYAAAGHSDGDAGHKDTKSMMEQMRKQHSAHEHGHDFEAMDKMSPAEMGRIVALMQDVGLVVPMMDAVRGRKLFVEIGCVVCHSVNKVGGDLGPSLNAEDMPSPMNAFEFAARMWRGAAAMTAMQEDILGDIISLDGQDLADLIAFAHDESEQNKLTGGQIPEKFHKLMQD